MKHGTLSGYTNDKCRCDACRERWRDYQADYHRKHKERLLGLSAKRYEANRKDRLEKKKVRYRTPEGRRKAKMYLATKEALQKGGQFVEHVDRTTLYEMWGGMCGICNDYIDGDFHVDHRVPLSRGGQHGYVNCQPTHPRCNLKKYANAKEVMHRSPVLS